MTPLLLPLLLALAPEAEGGLDADIELLRPTFSPGSLPGIESARPMRAGQVEAGMLLQVERDPLLLYEYGLEAGSLIGHRGSLDLGAAWGFLPRATATLLVPMSVQSAGDLPSNSVPGPGLGDPSVGLRWSLFKAGAAAGALKGDLLLPVGRRNAFLGEGVLRPRLGLLLTLGGPRLRLLADGAWQQRSQETLERGLTWGPSLHLNAGLAWGVFPDRLDAWTGLLSRGELTRLWEGGSGNAAEWISGLRGRAGEEWRWTAGLGRGLSEGAGTTALRGMLGLEWTRPSHPRPPSYVVLERGDAPPDDVPEQRPETATWAEGELSRVDGENIAIREPVLFEFGSARILEESKQVLLAVARTMNDSYRIAHVVIIGHTSEEGSYLYNLDLSLRRAQAVFQALVEAGVDPSRLSIQGMGEVVPPRLTPETVDSLEAERRVVFRITHTLPPDAPMPAYADEVVLPWSGARVRLLRPARLPLPSSADTPGGGAGRPKGNTVPSSFFRDDEDAGTDPEPPSEPGQEAPEPEDP